MTEIKKVLRPALFDVEHAINMYAYSYVTMPADAIYDKKMLSQYSEILSKCHIYIIGFHPTIQLIDANQVERNLSLNFKVNLEDKEVTLPLPDDLDLLVDGDTFSLVNKAGKRMWFNDIDINRIINQSVSTLEFNIQYIGQSYGKDGSRNAMTRLLKHETLQKIALQGVPEGQRLTLLLLEIEPSNRLITSFNPHAEVKDEGSRIKSGLEKLYSTSEQERISLYEASLIRYFSPKFNKEFKNSFPSTNLKVLQDCYEKDFSAVIAEISISELPFQLCSDTIKASPSHISKHHLHDDAKRKIFFFESQ